jgi:hypothetical protein
MNIEEIKKNHFNTVKDVKLVFLSEGHPILPLSS